MFINPTGTYINLQKSKLVIYTKEKEATIFDVEDKNDVVIEKDNDFVIVYIKEKFVAMIRKESIDRIYLMDEPKVI